MRVLIADDDTDLRHMLDLLLSEYGYETMPVPDGTQAMALLQTDDPPRLLILDWSMPGADGVDICRTLRAAEADTGRPYSYIVIVTGRDNVDDVVAGLEAGADDFITKPFVSEELRRRIGTGVRILEYEQKLAAKNEQLKAEISERKRGDDQRRALEQSLYQSRKLQSIGTLAAGIAHEINTPMQFIGDNTRFLTESNKSILALVDRYQRFVSKLPGAQVAYGALAEIRREEAAADLAFLRDEIPRSLDQCRAGICRVADIVAAMKDFACDGSYREKSNVDLNDAIRSAATISSNEWRYVAEMRLILDPDLPSLPCFPGEVKQALLNLIVNAAHSISEQVGSAENISTPTGLITINTSHNDRWAIVRLSDTGTGIPADIQEKVFDPFFTTKDVGEGMGQGLAIAHSSIVRKHGGTLTFETEEGKGTTFEMKLPLEHGKQELRTQ